MEKGGGYGLAIILAAGASKRFGIKDKLICEINVKSVIQHTIDLYHQILDINHILVVVDHSNETLIDHLRTLSVTLIFNKEPHLRMSNSIRCALMRIIKRSLRPSFMFIHPGDVPGVGIPEIEKLLKNLKNSTETIFIPQYLDETGHPILFEGSHLNRLLTINEEKFGLRGYLTEYQDEVKYITVKNELILVDIDTEDDITKFRSLRTDSQGYNQKLH